MKKIIFAVTILILCYCNFVYADTSSNIGDINNDGLIDKNDASLLSNYLIDNNITDDIKLLSDINSDNYVRINDLMLLLDFINIKDKINNITDVSYLDEFEITEADTNIVFESSNDKIAVFETDEDIIKLRFRRTGSVTISMHINSLSFEKEITVSGNRIHFINLGQAGNAFLLESNGEFALYDAGKSSDNELINYIKDRYGINYLKFIIISHPHIDHNGEVVSILNSDIAVHGIYKKNYTNLDSDKVDDVDNASNSSIYAINKEILDIANEKNVVIVNVDDFVNKYEGKSVITLGDMEFILYNVRQRIVNDSTNHPEFDYDTSDYWAGKGENINSIVALVRVNNHNVLLSGDLTHYSILTEILSRVNTLIEDETIDIYNIPHHANYNCTDEEELMVDATYYVASTYSDVLASGNQYFRISDNLVGNGAGELVRGCFNYMGISMFDAYYTADAVYASGNKGAVVANLDDNLSIKYGKNRSCRYPNNGQIYDYDGAINANTNCSNLNG